MQKNCNFTSWLFILVLQYYIISYFGAVKMHNFEGGFSFQI